MGEVVVVTSGKVGKTTAPQIGTALAALGKSSSGRY